MRGCPRGFDTCPLVLLAALSDPLLVKRCGKWECVTVDQRTGHITHGHGVTAEAAIVDRVEETETLSGTAAKE